MKRRLGACAAAALLGACAVGPDYRRPVTVPTTAYKELGTWKPSEPADDLGRGPWWRIFDDSTLDGLEAEIAVSNQNVKAAVAAYDPARALVDQATAGFWPTLSASLARTRGSSEGFQGAVTTNATSRATPATNDVTVPGSDHPAEAARTKP